jgi:hypothetical protein
MIKKIMENWIEYSGAIVFFLVVGYLFCEFFNIHINYTIKNFMCLIGGISVVFMIAQDSEREADEIAEKIAEKLRKP